MKFQLFIIFKGGNIQIALYNLATGYTDQKMSLEWPVFESD